MKLRRLTCYELERGEKDDGTKPVLHRFTVEEASEIQDHLESGHWLSGELRQRLATAFAHASVISID